MYIYPLESMNLGMLEELLNGEIQVRDSGNVVENMSQLKKRIYALEAQIEHRKVLSDRHAKRIHENLQKIGKEEEKDMSNRYKYMNHDILERLIPMMEELVGRHPQALLDRETVKKDIEEMKEALTMAPSKEVIFDRTMKTELMRVLGDSIMNALCEHVDQGTYEEFMEIIGVCKATELKKNGWNLSVKNISKTVNGDTFTMWFAPYGPETEVKEEEDKKALKSRKDLTEAARKVIKELEEVVGKTLSDEFKRLSNGHSLTKDIFIKAVGKDRLKKLKEIGWKVNHFSLYNRCETGVVAIPFDSVEEECLCTECTDPKCGGNDGEMCFCPNCTAEEGCGEGYKASENCAEKQDGIYCLCPACSDPICSDNDEGDGECLCPVCRDTDDCQCPSDKTLEGAIDDNDNCLCTACGNPEGIGGCLCGLCVDEDECDHSKPYGVNEEICGVNTVEQAIKDKMIAETRAIYAETRRLNEAHERKTALMDKLFSDEAIARMKTPIIERLQVTLLQKYN